MIRFFSFVFLFLLSFCSMAMAEVSGEKPREVNPFDHPQTIEKQGIEEALKVALEREVGTDFEAALTQHPFPLEVVADRQVSYKIEDIRVNPQKTRFTASLVFEDYDVKPIKLGGGLTIMTKVPALARVINPREKIMEEDIEWVTLPAHRVTKSAITDAAQLIGAEPWNAPLKPGVLLRTTDLKRSHPVQKGQIILVTLSHPKMVMNLKAKALEDGDIGGIIKLNNVESHRTLYAKVLEEGHAIVESDETR